MQGLHSTEDKELDFGQVHKFINVQGPNKDLKKRKKTQKTQLLVSKQLHIGMGKGYSIRI